MEFAEFVRLSTAQVALLMRDRAAVIARRIRFEDMIDSSAEEREPSLNAVFWVNGTRRWFASRSLEVPPDETTGRYVEAVADGVAAAFDLLYSHGIRTIICPAVHYSNLLRGNQYIENYLLPLVDKLCSSRNLLQVLDRYRARVYPYGEIEDLLGTSQKARYLAAIQAVRERTRGHDRCSLFVGFCASPSAIATLRSVRSLAAKGRGLYDLSHDELVTEYYGGNIDRVHLTIAHGRMASHSTPFLTTGDLYFQMSPSLYLDELCLRTILYDFLFSRSIDDWSYADVPEVRWGDIAAYYEQNRHQVVGLGRRSIDGKLWAILGRDAADAEVQRRIFGA